jgi:CO dehydrogenase/acetyl-CoA synthase beta subunit
VRAEELGLDGFIDKIADETIATGIEELTPWLESAKHPALEMEPLL